MHVHFSVQTEARRLGSAISKAGIGNRHTVSVMIPNVPLGVMCHFAVPGIGATLHMINTRLDARAVAFQVGCVLRAKGGKIPARHYGLGSSSEASPSGSHN